MHCIKFMILFLCLIVNLEADTSIRSLSSADVSTIEKLTNDPAIAIIFQTNCASCKAQIQDLDCLKDKIDIFLVGAFSNEKELKIEYLKYFKDFKAYYGDKEVLSYLDITEVATPQIVLLSKTKKVKIKGYNSCEKLAQKLFK